MKEKKGLGEIGRREERREGRVRRRIIKGIVMVLVMMVMGCNSGGVEGGEGESSQSKFLKSIIGLRNEFLNVFTSFGDMVGGILGFNAVKSDDKRSKVGEHFKSIGDGLKNTKDKLDELSKKIVATPNADTTTVETVIKGSSEIIAKLVTSVTKLAGVVGNTDVGDNAAAAAVAAEEVGVKTVIDEIKAIVGIAEKSGVKIVKGTAGVEVTAGANTDAPAVIAANVAAGQGAGSKLVEEVVKADPWAMVDKIKNAKIKQGNLNQNDNNDAGELATGTPNHANGAKAVTNADLAAAVALKAMTKAGKFSANNADTDIVKVAAANALNKVLGILDVIIKKTVNLELDKVKEVVKGIKYFETPGSNSPEAGTTQASATK
ncbi:Variable major protein (plasmid) [Borrelia crocidurae DOU]|uniref:Variable large protein n=1 Tax=Borrelia crocidurae DOU TaxID=1293575 RepID=W5SLP0_9SPIR|nr:variable large family protein [Borrelia crocidurae]AHH07785.1 Variable major protein [Borrelia crocidurae DOU]